MLIAVALIGMACGYVGYEWSIVVARKAWVVAHPPRAFLRTVEKGDRRQIPLIRRLIGDQQQSVVVVVTEDEIPMVRSLFPEADIAYVGLLMNLDIP